MSDTILNPSPPPEVLNQESIVDVDNFRQEFPDSAIAGEVYFTPAMVVRGSDQWNGMSKEDQTAQDIRRIGVLKGTINVSAMTIKEVTDERNKARIDAENQRQEKLESSKLSLTDDLTGLENRRALNRHIESMDTDEKSSAVAAFIDLDKFKSINETQGHEMGDKVLQSVATALQEFKFRSGDKVFRLAGDEFVVILKDAMGLLETELDDDMIPRTESSPDKIMKGFIERLQSAISAQVESDTSLKISASIGVEIPSEKSTIQDAIKEADKKMFEAKRRADPELKNRMSKIMQKLLRNS